MTLTIVLVEPFQEDIPELQRHHFNQDIMHGTSYMYIVVCNDGLPKANTCHCINIRTIDHAPGKTDGARKSISCCFIYIVWVIVWASCRMNRMKMLCVLSVSQSICVYMYVCMSVGLCLCMCVSMCVHTLAIVIGCVSVFLYINGHVKESE